MPCSEKVLMLTKRAISTLVADAAPAPPARAEPRLVRVSMAS